MPRRAQDKFQGMMEQPILPPNWPDGYKKCYGIVLRGNVSDSFTFLAWTLVDNIAYLIPNSINCGCSLHTLTQSKRSKYDKGRQLAMGNSIYRFTVANNTGLSDDERDYTVKSYVINNKASHIPEAYREDEDLQNCLLYECVFSEPVGGQQKCHAFSLGTIPISPVFLNAKGGQQLVPNIVYLGVVHCRLEITNNKGVPNGGRTRVEVRPELIGVEGVKRVDTESEYADMVALLRTCDWNHRATSYKSDADVEPKSGPLLPPAPRPLQHKVVLWYFHENIVIRANWPRTVVKFVPGTLGKPRLPESDDAEEKKPRPALEPGRCALATLVYSEFIGDCYYVQEYCVKGDCKGWMPEKDWDDAESRKKYRPGQAQLPRRTVIEKGSGQVQEEYFIRIAESTQFRDFYTSEPLLHCLIADPQRVLRNVDFELHQRSWGVPVWIRLNRTQGEQHWLAHFSVVALAKDSGEYSTEEKQLDQPMITGRGLLADLATGAVFSPDHPQKAIRMSARDQAKTAFGHFFYFTAAFWPQREHYVIGSIQPIGDSVQAPVETFLGEHGQLLFADTFSQCFIRQMDDVHFSDMFGPVDDRKEQFVTMRTRKARENWPSEADGFITLNPHWVPGRSAQMKVAGLELPAECVNVTSNIPEQCSKSLGVVDQQQGDSRFYELFHLIHEVSAANCDNPEEAAMDGELYARVEELKKECAEVMKLEEEEEK